MTTPSFFLGVNYPWANYAEDFGVSPSGHRGLSLPENLSKVGEEFSRIRDCGASVVRWFLFADGRGGFLTEKGIPLRPDEFVFADVRAALAVAERNGLKLCFSLMDYLWLQDRTGKPARHSNEQVLQFAAGREGFLHRVLIPMFREFHGHPGLFAWEVANEPEWAIREFHRQPAAKMHYADFRAFAEEIVQAVRQFAGVPATMGSASLSWVRAWSELGLDFYQAHYYPVQDPSGKSSLARQLACMPPLDKPLWLGELPARDDQASGYSLKGALTECRDAGMLGAAVWRWTAPESAGSDAHLGSIDPEVLAGWSSALSSRNASV